MHRLGALRDQTNALTKRERAGGDQRGVLAQAVARAETRVEAGAFDRIEHHEAGHERRELCVARVLQLFGVGVEQQSLEVALDDFARLTDQLPGIL